MNYLEVIGSLLGITMALSPSFGDGTNIPTMNPWRYSGGSLVMSSSTADLRVPNLANLPCIGADAQGDLGAGTCGSGSGTGTVSTSTIPTVGQVAYWTNNGFPSLLGSVATGTLSCTSPLSCTARSIIGGSSAVSLDTSGTWTGNAGTASALAANGTNASAGNAILGVDASGNAEGAFDVWTEAENTAAAYAAQATTLTVAGTASQITSSAGAQDLSANRTWTLSLPNHVIFPSSFQASRASTTNATSTNLDITGLFTFNGVTASTWAAFCTAITGGVGLCDGSDASGSGGAGLATSTPIADTYVIYGTSAADVGAEAAFTYDDATNKLVVENASTTAFSSPYASSTNAVAGLLSISTSLTIGGDTLIELCGTGITCTSNTLAASLGTSISAAEIADGDHGDFTYTSGVAAIDANAVALGTDTVNNYVATIADDGQSTITVNNSGTETAAVTLRVIDVVCTGCLGSTEIAGLDISADTNLAATYPIVLSNDTVTFSGLSTTTPWTGSGVAYRVSDSLISTVATSSATCSTGVSCSAFDVLGTAAPVITATLGTSVDLTSEVTGDLPYSNLAQVSANSILGNPTGATADAQSVATTTLFGALGTAGQVLMSNGTGIVWAATSTCIQITGSADLCDGNDASGGGGSSGNIPFATTTVYTGQDLIYPVKNNEDFVLGKNSSTTAPFWWDVSATTTYVGNGGTGDSKLTLGPTSNEWTTGYYSTDKTFQIASSTSLGSSVAFSITKALRVIISTFLNIPNAADPSVTTTGDIAMNTTAASSSIRYYDGTAERVLNSIVSKPLVYASSTLAYIGSYGTAGTTTVLVLNNLRPMTIYSFYCKTDTGTAYVRFGDGTNWTTEKQCTSSGVSSGVLASNNTFTIREDFKVQVGTSASNPNIITITADVRDDAD